MEKNINKLVEIKKGQTGTGLLIENDGYLVLTEEDKKTLKESIGEDGGWHVPNPFIVSAVFQKYGIENANGRIYPEEVLKREVEKYQIKIQERRAYGECYRPEALILTEGGWKRLDEVKVGENILTLNENGVIETNPIKNIIRHPAKKLLHLSGRNINDYVTPEHGYPVYGRDNKFKGFYTATQIKNNEVPDEKHCYIPKTGKWVGRNDNVFVIPKLSEEEIQRIPVKSTREKYQEDLSIPMDVFAKFMGIYLSEGSCDKKGNTYRVNIHQKKEDVCEEIEKMLEEFPLNFTINKSKSGVKTFVISDIRLNKYLRNFGLCYDKFVPFELKQQNKEILRLFYDWFVLGDGRIRGDKRRKKASLSDDVFTTSKQLVRDLNEIQLKIGYSGVFYVDAHDYDRVMENGRIIKAENSQPIYFTYKSLTKGVYLDDRFLSIEEVDYEGDVMCVEVENHTWYVSDNGKCHWTKNCNHPSEITIDLGRIAMNIIELHWEGHTLVGKMEIETSEAFRRYGAITCLGDMVANHLINGLKIGVSSRGLGSVENKFGKIIVGDDYELVCWDIVSDPSTPGSWISFDENELKQYVESDESKKDGNKLFETLKNFENWLNE